MTLKMIRIVSKWLLVPPKSLLLVQSLEISSKVMFENVVASRAPWLDGLGGPGKIWGARAPGPPPISTPEAILKYKRSQELVLAQSFKVTYSTRLLLFTLRGRYHVFKQPSCITVTAQNQKEFHLGQLSNQIEFLLAHLK